MRYKLIIVLLALSIAGKGQEPMKVNVQNSALNRWLNKNVLEYRVLDSAETSDHWVPFATGAISLVDSRMTAKTSESKSMVTSMNVTEKKSHSGNRSIVFRFPTKLDLPGPKSGRGWGNAGVRRIFENEDWSKFNRISLWVYPDNPGSYQNWLELRLYNEGHDKLPALFGQEGENTVNLNNQEWNHVVWEMDNVTRDKISRLEISTIMSGNEPETTDTLTFYLDDLKLEKVEPDYIEGWPVSQGRIAFSHAGYQTGSPKSAIANDLNTDEFTVVDEKTGKSVLNKPIRTVTSHLGTFQLLDFSEIEQCGLYHIEAGKTVTQPFPIGPDVWEQTLRKALNFFYAERCGTPIPEVHGICHRDWTCVHGDKRIVINGGWHDAGDFTQGLRNTGEAVYAMFSLAEQMNKNVCDFMLYDQLLDEAKWGLDWILQTSFGDGFRNEGSANSRRTNGIIGDFDDVTSEAKNTPKSNFIASSAEAIAYRVLKERDPRLAYYSLKMAKADWQFAVDKLRPSEEEDTNAVWSVSFDSGNILHEVASAGILASVELWHATGDSIYSRKAVELAKIILESQQRKILRLDIPLYGFFYTSPAKKNIMHYCHNGREQEPVAALNELCKAFPDHPDWMKWYSAVALHSNYLKTIAGYTEPYGVLPSSVYTDKDYLQVPESRRESFRQQVLNGVPLGKGYYLRIFPVWMDYRGHFGTILPQAQSLSIASRLQGDHESANLALLQMEWVSGRNPFSQSTMYGEGYDFPPLYTPSSGDIAGALPVGIQTRGDNDVPYWPVQSTWTYKEVWVHPVSQWIGLMRDISLPVVKESKGAGTISFEVSKRKSSKNDIIITAAIEGTGSHEFSIRVSNMIIRDSSKHINLNPEGKTILEWHGRLKAPDEPWIAVIIADNDLAHHKELSGTDWEN
jgi:hypothetical protein